MDLLLTQPEGTPSGQKFTGAHLLTFEPPKSSTCASPKTYPPSLPLALPPLRPVVKS